MGKMSGKCIHCGEEYSNIIHVKWCKNNPNLKQIKEKAIKIGKESSLTVRKAWKDGKFSDAKWNRNVKPHTEETKKKLSEIAKKSKHRRLVRSIREYKKLDGTIVLLDSSWEELMAKRLDFLRIEWIRPNEPLEWKDRNGIIHNYFPDFYLPYYDLFIDPKNPLAFKVQIEKIECLLETYNNIQFIKNVNDIQNWFPHLPV